ncbi:MAG: hypothetical protein HY077_12965 [Elusimicrobia bacterium]|nr:hypothetical protein [Elusimicrobiota bacterium]
MAKKRNCCIECGWCDLTVDLYGGSHYTCLKTGKTLPSTKLDRRTCADFAAPHTTLHWGP